MKVNQSSALMVGLLVVAGALCIVNTPNGPYGVFAAGTPAGTAYAAVPLQPVSGGRRFPSNNPNNYYLLPGYDSSCATLYPGDAGYNGSYPPYNRPGKGGSYSNGSSSRRGKPAGGLNIYGIPTSISIPVVVPGLGGNSGYGSSSRRGKGGFGGGVGGGIGGGNGGVVIIGGGSTGGNSGYGSSSRRGGKGGKGGNGGVIIVPGGSGNSGNSGSSSRRGGKGGKGGSSSRRRGHGGMSYGSNNGNGFWFPNGAYPGSPNQGYWNNNGNFNQNSFGANGGNGANAVTYQPGVQCLMVPTFGNPAFLISSYLSNLNSNLSNGASTWNLIYQNAVNNVYYYIYTLSTGTSGAQYIGIGYNAGNSQVVAFAMSASVSQVAGMLGVPVPTTSQAINCGNLQCVYTRNCSPNTAAPTLIGATN